MKDMTGLLVVAVLGYLAWKQGMLDTLFGGEAQAQTQLPGAGATAGAAIQQADRVLIGPEGGNLAPGYSYAAVAEQTDVVEARTPAVVASGPGAAVAQPVVQTQEYTIPTTTDTGQVAQQTITVYTAPGYDPGRPTPDTIWISDEDKMRMQGIYIPVLPARNSELNQVVNEYGGDLNYVLGELAAGRLYRSVGLFRLTPGDWNYYAKRAMSQYPLVQPSSVYWNTPLLWDEYVELAGYGDQQLLSRGVPQGAAVWA